MVSWLVPLRTLRFAELPLRPAGLTTAAVFVGGGGGGGGFCASNAAMPGDFAKHMIIP